MNEMNGKAHAVLQHSRKYLYSIMTIARNYCYMYLAAIDPVLLLGVMGAPICASSVFSVWYMGLTDMLALNTTRIE